MGSNAMSDAAREARNAYARQWRKDHPEKAKEYARRHWEKKARETASDATERDENGRGGE